MSHPVYSKFFGYIFFYLLVSWAWWDWPFTWLTNHRSSVMWHCWLGHLTRKIVSEMTYNVSSGTLNSTILQCILHYLRVMSNPVSASASRSHLRSAARGDLAVPRARTTTYGQRSFPSLVRHCGTRCRSLFVTHLWQWRSSAYFWSLFYFAEHIILSIAPSWQFRL